MECAASSIDFLTEERYQEKMFPRLARNKSIWMCWFCKRDKRNNGEEKEDKEITNRISSAQEGIR